MARSGEGLGRTIFMLGAGCSISAGIPGAIAVAQRMVRVVAVRLNLCDGTADASECYYRLVAARRLDARSIANPKGSAPADAIDWYKIYDDMFDRHYATPDQVRELFDDLVRETKGAINWAHLCLGEIVAQRFISTVLTTNFDQLALSGMARAGILPVICDGVESLNKITGVPKHPQLVELHGSRHSYLLRNAKEDVAAMGDSPQTYGVVDKLLQNATTFVIVGYGGREDGVMDQLVRAAKNFPDKYLFWINHSKDPAQIGDKVRAFLSTSRNARLFPDQDADRFFLDLSRALKIGAPGAIAKPLVAVDLLVRNLEAALTTDADIQAEIAGVRRRLARLQEADAAPEHDDPIAETVAAIRELRLKGRYEDAYRRAEQGLAE